MRKLGGLVFTSLLLACLAMPPAGADGAAPSFVLAWGSRGAGPGLFQSPVGVAVDSSGNVFVVDSGHDSVQKFDANGMFIRKWGHFGTAAGEFIFPNGVAADAFGNVYVADTYNDRIQKFDSSGHFLAMWGSSGSGNGEFDSPHGVAVDPAGNVYVTDLANERIQKFDSDGNFLLDWVPPGAHSDTWVPREIAVDAESHVYVTSGREHVYKFDSSGVLLDKWGRFGFENGEFIDARAIAVDTAANRVYVSDVGARVDVRMQSFTLNGKFVARWGPDGLHRGMFRSPGAGAVGPSGAVYLSDRYQSRIQKFSPA